MIEMTIYLLTGETIVISGRNELELLKFADELAGEDFDRLETREI